MKPALLTQALKLSPEQQLSGQADAQPPLTPIVASLLGLLKDKSVDEDDYKQYLERKYR